jgi:hypothetical protein
VRRLTSVRLVDWRKRLVYTHRWLGIAGCIRFMAWFVSGIVMMYARMPGLANEERLAPAPALDLSTIMVSPITTLDGVSRDEAAQIARRYAPDHTGPITYDGYVTEPDQWTILPALRRLRRLARVASRGVRSRSVRLLDRRSLGEGG